MKVKAVVAGAILFLMSVTQVFAQVETDGIMINLSTRGYVGTGDNVMIAGVCIEGPLTVIVRALGPSLRAYGVSGVLSDPKIEVYDPRGALVTSNDNWQNDPNAYILSQMGIAPSDPRESATIITAEDVCFTIVVKGVGGSTGVALVEVYDITQFSI